MEIKQREKVINCVNQKIRSLENKKGKKGLRLQEYDKKIEEARFPDRKDRN